MKRRRYAALGERLIAHVLANHSYDTPEVIITPIVGGNPDYLVWIDRETAEAR